MPQQLNIVGVAGMRAFQILPGEKAVRSDNVPFPY